MDKYKISQIEKIRDHILRRYGVSLSDILSNTRKMEIVKARDLSMYFADKKVKHTNMSEKRTEISRLCGRKTRSSVYNVVNKLEIKSGALLDLRKELEEIEREIDFLIINTEAEIQFKINELKKEVMRYEKLLEDRMGFLILGCA